MHIIKPPKMSKPGIMCFKIAIKIYKKEVKIYRIKPIARTNENLKNYPNCLYFVEVCTQFTFKIFKTKLSGKQVATEQHANLKQSFFVNFTKKPLYLQLSIYFK